MYFDEEQEYRIGDGVEHKEFGIGVILATDGKILTIAFNHKVGVKKLMKNHKSLRKL